MAETAYELQRFAPREEKAPRRAVVQVAKPHTGTAKQVFRMLRTLLTVGLLVSLVCGVLYTQTTMTELQSEISSKNQELVDQEAMYAYLSFELESKTTPRAIEQRAGELGLVPMNSNQITYVQVEEGNPIEIRKGPLDGLNQQFGAGLKAAADQLSPE